MNTLKQLDKATIRKQAIKMLELKGCKVWKQNNLAVKGRKFIGELGIADISGYHLKTAIRVECEVKTLNDIISKAQIEFLLGLEKAGGIALIAMQEGNQVVLKDVVETYCNNYIKTIK